MGSEDSFCDIHKPSRHMRAKGDHMKKKLLAVIFAMLLVCATVFSSSALTRIYRDAYDDDTEPTIRIRASLQGIVSSSGNYFVRMIAGMRFDPYDETLRPPTYTYLNMAVNAQAQSVTMQSYSTSGMVQIGDYISLSDSYGAEDGITVLNGQYVAQDIGSTIQFNPESISMTPYSQSEIPDT